MTLTLEIDEAQLPRYDGPLQPATVLMMIAGDAQGFFDRADKVVVQGTFGKYAEIR